MYTCMKKNFLLTLLLALSSYVAFAQQTVTIDGINYMLDGDKAIIVDQAKQASGDIFLPDDFKYEGQVYKVVEITPWAFQYCEGLLNIVISNNITTIPHDAFHGCVGLTSVTIGDMVDTIESNAFCDCIEIHQINIRNSMPPQIEFDSFFGVDKHECVVHVPIGSRAMFSNDIGWRQFRNIFEDE